jgi:hypothetical protein
MLSTTRVTVINGQTVTVKVYPPVAVPLPEDQGTPVFPRNEALSTAAAEAFSFFLD